MQKSDSSQYLKAQKPYNPLEGTEINFWSRSAGKSIRENLKNRISEIVNVAYAIVADINVNHLKLCEHVLRVPENRGTEGTSRKSAR